MRRTINISVPEEIYEFICDRRGYVSASEYIRRLVENDRQQRDDLRARPVAGPMLANDCLVIGAALEQLDKVRAILERE